jgi:hypothetical protein
MTAIGTEGRPSCGANGPVAVRGSNREFVGLLVCAALETMCYLATYAMSEMTLVLASVGTATGGVTSGIRTPPRHHGRAGVHRRM